MYYIRKTKTASKATAVQIVEYVNRKLVVANHIGSAHNTDELKNLQHIACDWIEKTTKQMSLLPPSRSPDSNLVILGKCEFLGIHYTFLYEALHKLLARFQFTAFGDRLLVDLVIIRLVEPASKLRSMELLREYFGVRHRRQNFYESLPKLIKRKDAVERLSAKLAIREMDFDFSLVFYDVTTLYFESFESDDLRKPGFSKDNKAQQPQIVIGLMVTKEGFPVAYEMFEGNTFEGHTLIPVITAFKKKHGIETLTVVADAAMISFENIQALKDQQLRYIVGARIGNLPHKVIQEVSSKLNLENGATVRITTNHGDLVCDFSSKRYAKDKREMERQIKKAEKLLRGPSALKRTKFIKANETKYELNVELVEKTKKLLGIKGYCTNLGLDTGNQAIIDHYHNLWRVEQAFRIAKSDLETRPIFHFKENTIKAHLLICFMALAVSKYIEIKTGKSIQYVLRSLKRVTDARMINTITKKEIIVRTKIPEEIFTLLQQLGLPY